jgi:hypothetical protein
MMHWRFWRRKQRDIDLNDEIAYDLAADAEERIRSGIAREEAERASHRDFGNVLLLKEDIREVWGWTSVERLGSPLWQCCPSRSGLAQILRSTASWTRL